MERGNENRLRSERHSWERGMRRGESPAYQRGGNQNAGRRRSQGTPRGQGQSSGRGRGQTLGCGRAENTARRRGDRGRGGRGRGQQESGPGLEPDWYETPTWGFCYDGDMQKMVDYLESLVLTPETGLTEERRQELIANARSQGGSRARSDAFSPGSSTKHLLGDGPDDDQRHPVVVAEVVVSGKVLHDPYSPDELVTAGETAKGREWKDARKRTSPRAQPGDQSPLCAIWPQDEDETPNLGRTTPRAATPGTQPQTWEYGESQQN